ncbi:MAG: serine/threonine protein kinase, partial [Deltaproteobacteria bacterium]|nr:serine/threonine protein kinase [Deltaproteobacteria bacterium]
MGLQLGRYELLRPLARGGMAEVFLARRRGPGGVEKQLVVKRIAREKSRDPRFAEMFVTEARLSMSLAHRNIVPVFDFGRAGDELFLVMEFVDGVDLGRALARSRQLSKPMSPVLLAFVGMEAAQALDYAHTSGKSSGEGVIHRDVTPGNVLVSTAGEVKLVD